MNTPGAEVSGFITILLVQLAFLVVFGIFVRYDTGLLPTDPFASPSQIQSIEEQHRVSYPRKYHDFVNFAFK